MRKDSKEQKYSGCFGTDDRQSIVSLFVCVRGHASMCVCAYVEHEASTITAPECRGLPKSKHGSAHLPPRPTVYFTHYRYNLARFSSMGTAESGRVNNEYGERRRGRSLGVNEV